MTNKICKKCGTYQSDGFYCEECGVQLFPDIGNTEWNIPSIIKRSEQPKFDRWSGKKKEAKPQNVENSLKDILKQINGCGIKINKVKPFRREDVLERLVFEIKENLEALLKEVEQK